MLSSFVKLYLSNQFANRFFGGCKLLLLCLTIALCWNVVGVYTAIAAPLVHPAVQDSPLSPLDAPAQAEAAAAPVVVATPLPVPPETILASQAEVISPAASAGSGITNTTLTGTLTGTDVSVPVKDSQTSLTLVGLVLLGVLLVVGVVAGRQR